MIFRKIFILLIAAGACFAEMDPKIFGSAFENYLTGNYAQALPDAKKLYEANRGDEKACDLYHKTLVKMALENEEKETYKEALGFIQDAEKIKPTDEVKEIKERILSKMKALDKKEPEEKAPLKKKIKKNVEKKSENKKDAPQEKPEVQVKEKEAEKDKITEVRKPEVPAQMRYPTSIFILLFFNLLGLIFLMYFVATAFSGKKEKKLIDEERRISQIVQTLGNKSEYQALLANQKEMMAEIAKLPEETSMMKMQNAEVIRLIERLTKKAAPGNIELPQDSARAGIAGVDDTARIRADTVELITEMFKDSPILEDLLAPYINDENNRVRGNACKALFPRNRKRAIEVLNEMASSDNVWMRMSAAWVCGELATSECVKILKPLINDTSFHVRKRAVFSFDKLKEVGIELPAEVEEKIYELKEKEG